MGNNPGPIGDPGPESHRKPQPLYQVLRAAAAEAVVMVVMVGLAVKMPGGLVSYNLSGAHARARGASLTPGGLRSSRRRKRMLHFVSVANQAMIFSLCPLAAMVVMLPVIGVRKGAPKVSLILLDPAPSQTPELSWPHGKGASQE